MWWKRHLTLRGSVYFQGALTPTLESLEGLEVDGLSVQPIAAGPDDAWAAKLAQVSWGEATVRAQRRPLPLPAALVDFAPMVSDADRERARRAGACLLVESTPREGDVLRDRKAFLRLLSALLGRDGLVAVDALSSQLWTPARLAEELSHDAPVDIDQIYVLHCVGDAGEAPTWVHSHGLAEIGFVDFDVLRPAAATINEQFDLYRSLAYAIVEGHGGGPIALTTGTAVSLVPVAEFTKRANASDVALRDGADDHTTDRAVVCDPPRESLSFFRRLFTPDRPLPAHLFCKGMDLSRQVVTFSRSATHLMAERAHGTVGLFEAMRGEFAFLEPRAVVKLGYAVDGSEDLDDREHLWFEVHGFADDRVDATLLNSPFRIARMKTGQRGLHDLALLTDWALFTPVGTITPRNLGTARLIRERREELDAAMASADGKDERLAP